MEDFKVYEVSCDGICRCIDKLSLFHMQVIGSVKIAFMKVGEAMPEYVAFNYDIPDVVRVFIKPLGHNIAMCYGWFVRKFAIEEELRFQEECNTVDEDLGSPVRFYVL